MSQVLSDIPPRDIPKPLVPSVRGPQPRQTLANFALFNLRLSFYSTFLVVKFCTSVMISILVKDFNVGVCHALPALLPGLDGSAKAIRPYNKL